MIEVFKTNVQDRAIAADIVEMIHAVGMGYRANFDLEDCDRILRVAGALIVDNQMVIRIVRSFGCEAYPLEDVPAFS
ncbi:MAG TPA: hypothetical protein VKZ68_10710 [Ohtaekwangia sp.]|nr:hypothetical protein [Ohtaekwangia sp.]